MNNYTEAYEDCRQATEQLSKLDLDMLDKHASKELELGIQHLYRLCLLLKLLAEEN